MAYSGGYTADSTIHIESKAHPPRRLPGGTMSESEGIETAIARLEEADTAIAAALWHLRQLVEEGSVATETPH